jgi:hypothetical protein
MCAPLWHFWPVSSCEGSPCLSAITKNRSGDYYLQTGRVVTKSWVLIAVLNKPEPELRGLVWSLTSKSERSHHTGGSDCGWIRSPAVLAGLCAGLDGSVLAMDPPAALQTDNTTPPSSHDTQDTTPS